MRLSLACLLLSAPLAARADVCPSQPLAPVRFPAGERLEYRLDLFGADVGTFDVSMEKGQAPATWLLRSRAKTSAFVATNVRPYEAFATASVSRDFLPLHYREDVDDGDVHKGAETDFPHAPGALDVRVTTAGKAEQLKLDAGAQARELMSALYVLRAQPLKQGHPVCVEVYAGRKMWKVQGQVASHETIETPLGKFPTMRIDAQAVRVDDANVKRSAHVWVTDDDRRLPLVAIGEVRGKTLRAQLIEATSLKKRTVEARDEHRNAIGR